jgi:Phosphotransferase enzyme family
MSVAVQRQLEALREALVQQWPQAQPWVKINLEPLKAKGLAHDHVRLVGTGWLARIPKQSQMQLGVADNLAYQKACFDRASPAGHSPGCIRVLQSSDGLPRGAFIVQEIVGRPAQLPQDAMLMASSMAAMHRLVPPEPSACAPLMHAVDPLQAMLEEVHIQGTYLREAQLESVVAAYIHDELARLRAMCQARSRPLKRLIAFDGHPGNFVIKRDAAGRDKAYLVDLEKCRYSYPSFDLAHATLYTSTTWDIDSHTILSPDEVMDTYSAWAHQVDQALALDAQRWHLPLRRAMWLWSITWCAKWRVASRAAAAQAQDGEDWSAQNLDPALASHVRNRVDHYLSATGVAWVAAEFEALQQRIAAHPI